MTFERKMRIRRARLLFLLSIPLAFATLANAQDPSAELSVLSKWIQTKKENAALRADWIVKKQDLLQEETLLNKEAESLHLQLETLQNLNATLLLENESTTAEQSDLLEQIAHFETQLDSYTQTLNATLPQLPPPLAKSIQSILKQTPERNNSLGAHYQRLITAIAEIHAFSNENRYQVEIHTDPSGSKRQMDTLYWGLSLAYSCDTTATVALIGKPSESGWQWSDLSQHAPQIRTLLDVQKGRLPPAYVLSPTSPND